MEDRTPKDSLDADLQRLRGPEETLEAERIHGAVMHGLFGVEGDPVTVGRYEVLGRIGEGGMGVVYRARDPHLDRTVALKLVRAHQRTKERLRREAKAAARVKHPNVVEVFDVGDWRSAVYIAMELIEGNDGKAWAVGASTPEILRVYADAGRGLQAVHEAGLVHRDFKPANVMVADDGRVKVLDFGLARFDDAVIQSDGADPRPVRGDASTEAGEIVGTLLYMPPEQMRTGAVDARADQFAFAASVCSALVGSPVFAATNIVALLELKEANRLPPLVGVPRRLRMALRRALAPDPAERFADLQPLIAALDAAHRPRRWPLVALAALAPAAVALAVTVVASEPSLAACGDGFEAWDEQRTQMRIAFEQAAGIPGTRRFARTVAEVDDALSSYRTERVEACAAAPSATRDAQLHCLQRWRTRARALVEALLEVDDAGTRLASEAVRTLGRPTTCRTSAIDATPRATEPLWDEVARVSSLISLGRKGDAESLAGTLWERARRTDDQALVVEVGRLYAETLSSHDPATAKEVLEDAYAAAAALALHERAAQLAGLLIGVCAVTGAMEEARLWERHARAAIDAGDLRGRAIVELQIRLSERHRIERRSTDALASLERAEAELAGDPSAFTARDATRLHLLRAPILLRLERVAEAEAVLLAAREALADRDDPMFLAPLHGAMATLYAKTGRRDAAIDAAERALASTITARGDAHPSVAKRLLHIASVLVDAGRFAEALDATGRAIEIREALGDARDGLLRAAQQLRGRCLAALGRHAEARDVLERVLLTTADSDDPRERALRASTLVQLSVVADGEERPAAAAALAQEARELSDTAVKQQPRRSEGAGED